MNNIKELLSKISADCCAYDDSGIPQIAELSRCSVLNSDHDKLRELYAALQNKLQLSMTLDELIAQVLDTTLTYVENAAYLSNRTIDIKLCKPALLNPDLVLFHNGAVMLLPPKSLEQVKVWSFNRGWGQPTWTNVKTVMAAACCCVFNSYCWQTMQLPAQQQAVNAAFYAVKEVGLSANCDYLSFAQLID